MNAHCSLEDLIRFVEKTSTKLQSEHIASCERCRSAAVLLATDIGRMKTKKVSTLLHTRRDEHLSIICRNGRFHASMNSGFTVLNPLAARGKKAEPSYISSYISVIPYGNTITIVIPVAKKECTLLRDNTVVEHLSGNKTDIIFSKLSLGSYTVIVDGNKSYVVFTSGEKTSRTKVARKRP